MKHYTFIILLLFTLHLGSAEQKNVLFIAIDDLRPELGCYGNTLVKSPHIDALAKKGLLFQRAYCQQSVCNPSRASVLTGLRPDSTRVWDLSTHFRKNVPDVITLPQHFKNNGYTAVGMGKIFHNSLPDPQSWTVPQLQPAPTNQYSKKTFAAIRREKEEARAAGKSDFYIANRIRGPATEMEDIADDQRVDGALTTLAINQLQTLADSKNPFFMAVGYYLPHLPFTPPKKYWDLYNPLEIPLADNQYLPKGAPAVAFGDNAWGGTYELRDTMHFRTMPSPFEGSLEEEQQRHLKHGYYASISFVDTQIGKLLAELERLQLTENTIIVLWSDHGWKLGEHNGWCKQTNYEIDTRTPLLICTPQYQSEEKECKALVEFVDIYPSICALAGLPIPEHTQGRSLVPLINNPKMVWDHAAYSQFPRSHGSKKYMGYTIRTDRFRFVAWLDQTNNKVTETELYDHQNDPHENNNVVNDPQFSAVLEELASKLNTQFAY